MDTILVLPIIETLKQLPPEAVSLILFAVCMISLLTLFRLFGGMGLYLFNTMAILTANIQVLKVVQFQFSAEPIALGTIVFASTYLASNLLTEHYGERAAKQGVWYGFAAQICMTLLMWVAIGYPSLAVETLGSDKFSSAEYFMATERAMALLFTPAPRILFASLLAYMISQWFDITVFQALKRMTQQKWLWLRSGVSLTLSALVDTLVFSVLAWQWLSPTPVSFSTLIFTYVLGAFVMRLLVAGLSLPVMYLSYFFKPQGLLKQSLTEKEVY